VDVVASGLTTILIVSNSDGTIGMYVNASAVQLVVYVEFTEVCSIEILFCIKQRVRLHRKPILGIFS
jgi:hypothetical protein